VLDRTEEALNALPAAVAEPDEWTAAREAALAALDDLLAEVVGEERLAMPAQRAAVLGSLLATVVHEYEEAVADGQIVNLAEYQDATGFTSVGRAYLAESPAELSESEAIADAFERLDAAMPTVTAPDEVAPAEDVAEAVADARAELDALAGALVVEAVPDPVPDPVADPVADPEPDMDMPLEGDLILYSGRVENLIQPVIDAFEAENPDIDVALRTGDNAGLAATLIEEAEAGQPRADVFLTTDMIIMEALAEAGVLAAYEPEGVEAVDEAYRDPDALWTGLTKRARVIMYNTDLVDEAEAPASILDLADPAWRGRVASAGSANASFVAHVAALRQLLGEEETEAWLQGLIDNETQFFGGHTDVRRAVGAGEFAVGLVNHYYYQLEAAEGSPVAVVYPDQGAGGMGVVVNATAVGVVEGGPNPELARRFVDFLLTAEAQELFAELNYEYPVVDGVPLHEGVQPLTDLTLADVSMPALIDEREATVELLQAVGTP
jgi:iron(III) transport system substrate-binding protein